LLLSDSIDLEKAENVFLLLTGTFGLAASIIDDEELVFTGAAMDDADDDDDDTVDVDVGLRAVSRMDLVLDPAFNRGV
jgi:hypothetical protein